MTRLVKITIILCIILYSGKMFAFNPQGGDIKITPLPNQDGERKPIGFQMKATWMDGTIEMRFPETLDGEEGMYFIDHYRADMPVLSKMEKYPEWVRNEKTGEISYTCSTPQGIEFGGIISTDSMEVRIEFFVKNHSSKEIRHISPQLCLDLKNSQDFNTLKTTSDVHIWSEGKYISLDQTTPTSAQKRRDALLVIGRKGFSNMEAVGKTTIKTPGEDIGQWWLINETSDEDIIVRESTDKKHLVATSWPGEVSFLIFNSQNPCIHAGPSIEFTIGANRERHWYGTVYLMPNNPNELLIRYKNGQRKN